MQVHSVYFWLDDLTDEEQQRFRDGLDALTGINLVEKGFVGVPANTDREVVDNSYDYVLVLFFEDGDDEKAYQEHPIHRQFVDDCEQYWEDLVVYDSVEMG